MKSAAFLWNSYYFINSSLMVISSDSTFRRGASAKEQKASTAQELKGNCKKKATWFHHLQQ